MILNTKLKTNRDEIKIFLKEFENEKKTIQKNLKSINRSISNLQQSINKEKLELEFYEIKICYNAIEYNLNNNLVLQNEIPNLKKLSEYFKAIIEITKISNICNSKEILHSPYFFTVSHNQLQIIEEKEFTCMNLISYRAAEKFIKQAEKNTYLIKAVTTVLEFKR